MTSRYEDCDQCGERFSGEETINSYLREVDVAGGAVELVCIKHWPEMAGRVFPYIPMKTK